jgi:hypothetical protein
MNHVLDLGRKVCHVCRRPLSKDFVKEKEWCTNEDCQVYLFKFNIPYDTMARTQKAG